MIGESDENWIQHPVYTSYWFCEDGRVISTKKRTPRFVVGTTCGQYGYRATPVEGSKKIYVHRTICELFNGAPKSGQQCRHIDGDKTNNSASNLCWGTSHENHLDMDAHGTKLFGELNPMSKLSADLVDKIKELREETKMPYYKMAEIFGVSTMTVFRAATGRSWK